VIEAAGHDDERDAGVLHLGGHEVAQVVQPEGTKPGGTPVADEGLGDRVWLPGRDAAVVAEHEPVTGPTALVGVPGEQGTGGRIEVDSVIPLRLGGCEHRAIGPFHPAGAERHAVGVEVHVVPAQPEQLSPSRAP
jgi:hypothetical protein